MSHLATALIRRAVDFTRGTTWRLPLGGSVLGIITTFALLVRVIAVAPLASFPLTIGLAAAWCAWLERH